MFEKIKTNPKVLIFLLILALLPIIFLSIQSASKKSVVVTLQPETADLLVDGKETGKRKLRLSTGTHKIEAKQEGFATYSDNIMVPDTKDLTIVLDANSEEAQKFLKDNPDIQQEYNDTNSIEFNKTVDAVAKRYPYLEQLPIQGMRFSVDRGTISATKQDPKTAIVLHVTATNPSERRNAIRNIRDAGIKPEDVEIVFDDYVNLFLPELESE